MQRFIFAALAAVPVCALAQETTPLDPLVVTATGSEIRTSALAANVLVISREQIEAAQAGDLADLLRPYAGLEVERSGGPGQLSFLRIRGGESDHTLILVDGVRTNPATGAPVLEHIDPAQIERIEIIKGPRSTLYGADAVAGVINIITRRAARTGASFSGRTGSHDSSELTAGLRYADEGKHLGATLARSESEGIPICAEGGAPRGYNRTTVGIDGGVRRGALTLGLRALDARGSTEIVDFCGFGGNNPQDQAFQQQTVAAELGYAPEGIWSLRATASRIEDDLQQMQSDDFVRTVRPQLDVVNRLDFGAQALSLTLSAAHENADLLSFGSAITEEHQLYAVRLQHELDLDRHHLVAGVAYDDQDHFGSKTTWALDYGLGLWSGGELVASAGTGFRAPSVFERSGLGGNPDLKPETAQNYELGLRQRLGKTQLVDLRLFHTEVEDLIAFSGLRNENVREFRNQGVDLSYRLELQNWSATLTGLIQDPADRTANRPLLRRAKRSAGLKLLRRFSQGSVGLDVVATGARPDLDFNSFPARQTEVGGYGLVNLSGSLKLSPAWTLRAKIDNLLDRDYQTVLGYRQDGAAFAITLAWSN